MSESFAELFEESLQTVDMEPGSIVTGVVIDIDNEWVTVHAGLKSEGVIPLDQFTNANGECSLSVGDEVQVALETVEDGFGETKLSREKAKRAEAWKGLEAAHVADEVVMGVINGMVKGGFTVDIDSIRAFLPKPFGCFLTYNIGSPNNSDIQAAKGIPAVSPPATTSNASAPT